MLTETRELTIHEKLKVVKEVQEYLRLGPDEYRQLLLHVMKSNLARRRAPPREDDESDAA